MVRAIARIIAVGSLIGCASPAAPLLEQQGIGDGPRDVTGVGVVIGADTIQVDWLRCDFPKAVGAAPDSAIQP
jgi:hypothetical protein